MAGTPPAQCAVVLLSGGLDSATVLAMARDSGLQCFALSVEYGQRHRAELSAAARVATLLGAREHRTVRIDYGQFGGSALTDPALEVPRTRADGIPITYVPARNTLLLAIALGWAEVLQASEIHLGVNAVDYSGYPDCRPEFIAAFQALADVATKGALEGRRVIIRTPLVSWTKAEIIRRGHALGVDYGSTVSCYAADESGRACGTCDACHFRREGFSAAGLPDPTRYQ
jgi:7-cyano-7-deazaguanine synthase